VQTVVLPDLAREFLAGCQIPALFSTSLKMTKATISRERWLLTLPHTYYNAPGLKAIEQNAYAFLTAPDETQSDEGLPDQDTTRFFESQKILKQRRTKQASLHLGYDKEGNQDIRKLYYEYDDEHDPTVFIALKSCRGQLDIHRYNLCDPVAIIAQIPMAPDIKSIMQDIFSITTQPLPTLHVQSMNTLRQSLDINFSDMPFTAALREILYQLINKIQPDTADEISAAYSNPTHIALGQNESGDPFLTLYGAAYWVEPGQKQGRKA
jgi:hypothetical protein